MGTARRLRAGRLRPSSERGQQLPVGAAAAAGLLAYEQEGASPGVLAFEFGKSLADIGVNPAQTNREAFGSSLKAKL